MSSQNTPSKGLIENGHACLVVFYKADGTMDEMKLMSIDFVNQLCVDFNNGIEKRSFKAYDIGSLLAHKHSKN